MGILGIILFIVLMIICLVGLIIIAFGAPGTWVILIAAFLYDLLPWAADISTTTLLVLLGIAVLGEVLEYYIGAKAAKRYGASNWGVAGAIVGGIIGAFVGVPVFLIGSVLGLFIGAFLGAFIVEAVVKGNISKAFKAGIGAFRGRVGAMLVKGLLGIVMVITIITAVFL